MDGISHMPVSSYKAVIVLPFKNNNKKEHEKEKIKAFLPLVRNLSFVFHTFVEGQK